MSNGHYDCFIPCSASGFPGQRFLLPLHPTSSWSLPASRWEMSRCRVVHFHIPRAALKHSHLLARCHTLGSPRTRREGCGWNKWLTVTVYLWSLRCAKSPFRKVGGKSDAWIEVVLVQIHLLKNKARWNGQRTDVSQMTNTMWMVFSSIEVICHFVRTEGHKNGCKIPF